jgi:UDP-2,3-diacylglucosamine hydrolase
MATLFISDLHLDSARPAATESFLRFLETDARGAEELYILGDLFESWVGDDDPDPHHQSVIKGIKALTSSGVPAFFMRGNRDLMIGRRFAAMTGMTLMHDPTLVYMHGTSLLLSHGDIYCTDDHDYQRYRRFVNHPVSQFIYHRLPFVIRNMIVGGVRARSKTDNVSKPMQIMDVNQQSVETALIDHGVSTLLHGHTHRPGIHQFELNGATATRIVLGDWYEQGNVLRWDTNGPNLHQLSF